MLNDLAFLVSELDCAVVTFLLIFAAVHGVPGCDQLPVVDEQARALGDDC